MPKAEPTPVSPAHAMAIRQRMNANSPLDSLINELARQQAEIEELGLKLRMLRAQQGLADVLLPLVQAAPPGLQRARLDAGMPLAAEKGFYAMEYDNTAQPFRWTGPSPVFSFDLHLARSQALAVHLYIASGFGEVSDEIRVFTDGCELPVRREPVDGGFLNTLVLMPRAGLGITRLSVLVRKMFRPAGAALDSRLLGVVFRSLEVEPADDAAVEAYLAALDDLRLAHAPAPMSADLKDAMSSVLVPADVLSELAPNQGS